MTNNIVPRDFWPSRLPSLLSEDFWPQVFNINQSGLSLSEDDDHVYVEAAVPGLDAGDINISLHQGTLTVSGEHKAEDKGKRHYRTMQSSYGYQVALPSLVKENGEPDAELKNGILTITFEKLPEAKPKQIKVKE
jgi:HSP20 family protein